MSETTAGWLALAYTLPAEPSRKRVSIWRRLRKIGAVYLNEGVWIVPNSEAFAQQIGAIAHEIENMEGTAVAFAAYDLLPDQKERLQGRFLQVRAEEYAEIRKQSDRLMAHIERERKREHFSFPELEELEEDLDKQERWLEEVRQRDVIGSPEYEVVKGRLEGCRAALASFTDETYARSQTAPAGVNAPTKLPDS